MAFPSKKGAADAAPKKAAAGKKAAATGGGKVGGVKIPDPNVPTLPTNAKQAVAFVEHHGGLKKAITAAKKFAGFGEATEAMLTHAANPPADEPKKTSRGAKADAPAKKGGRPSADYSGKKIKVLTKDVGAREGSAKHTLRTAVIGCKTCDDALALDGVSAVNLSNMVKAGIIEIV